MKTADITDFQVCAAVQAYQEKPKGDKRWPYDFLQEWTGAPFKVCYSALERASKRALIDYGVSLRTGWLTPRGKKVLEEGAA